MLTTTKPTTRHCCSRLLPGADRMPSWHCDSTQAGTLITNTRTRHMPRDLSSSAQCYYNATLDTRARRETGARSRARPSTQHQLPPGGRWGSCRKQTRVHSSSSSSAWVLGPSGQRGLLPTGRSTRSRSHLHSPACQIGPVCRYTTHRGDGAEQTAGPMTGGKWQRSPHLITGFTSRRPTSTIAVKLRRPIMIMMPRTLSRNVLP